CRKNKFYILLSIWSPFCFGCFYVIHYPSSHLFIHRSTIFWFFKTFNIAFIIKNNFYRFNQFIFCFFFATNIYFTYLTLFRQRFKIGLIAPYNKRKHKTDENKNNQDKCFNRFILHSINLRFSLTSGRVK